MAITGNPYLDLLLNSPQSRGVGLPPLTQGPITPPFIPRTPTPAELLIGVATAQATPPPPVIDEGGAISMGATSSVPQFRPLPPMSEEVASLLNLLRGAGVNLDVPTAPARPPFLQGLSNAIQQGISAGLTNNPGEALLQLQERARQRADQEAQLRQESQQRRDNLLTNVITGVYSNRRDREERREVAEYGAERSLALEEMQQGRQDARTAANIATGREEKLVARVAKFGEMGIDSDTGRLLAEAEAGLRPLTPELKTIYVDRVGAEGKAKLAEMERKTRVDVARVADGLMQDSGRTINRAQAVRFAEHELLGKPLSKQDGQVYNRLRKDAPVTGGSGGSGGVSTDQFMRNFEFLKGALENARAGNASKEVEDSIQRSLINLTLKAPKNIELSYDQSGIPQAKIRGAATTAPVQESANRQAKRKVLVDGGYSDEEATRILNERGEQ